MNNVCQILAVDLVDAIDGEFSYHIFTKIFNATERRVDFLYVVIDDANEEVYQILLRREKQMNSTYGEVA